MDTKDFAVNLARKFNTSNPFALADHLHIIILQADFKNTLGFFNQYRRSKFIHLNNSMPERLKTFVCAHELGHAVMHHNINTPFLKQHTLVSTDKIERQANSFAVELLLPDNLIQENSGQSIFSLAVTFGVPQELVCLKNFTLDVI